MGLKLVIVGCMDYLPFRTLDTWLDQVSAAHPSEIGQWPLPTTST